MSHRNPSPGDASPLVTCAAFGVELLLKALHAQVNGKALRGHELAGLFQALPPKTQASLRARYVPHLEAIKKTDAPPELIFRKIGVEPGIDVTPSAALDGALKNMNLAFVQWRYISDIADGPPGGYFYFNCFEAFSAAAMSDEFAVGTKSEAYK